MNIFGTFAYGNIIKTFIPGIFIVFGMFLIIDSVNFWTVGKYLLIEYGSKNPILAVALMIPVAIFSGILCNSFCFSWFTPKFIGKEYLEKNSEFEEYRKSLSGEIVSHYANVLSIPDNLKDNFNKYTDINSLLLVRKDLSALQYLRESYWYYLEFQVNSIVAVAIIALGSISHVLLRYNADLMSGGAVFPYLFMVGLFAIVIIKLFWKAAKMNYKRHQEKTFSYLLGAYHVCKDGNK